MPRLAALQEWLPRQCPQRPFTLAPASADASFRRYFRATFADSGETRIIMDAPPEHENCRPFIHVAGLLKDAGLHAPEVLAADLDQGFLLLTDLGTSTFLQAMTAPEATPQANRAMFRDATAALVQWQAATRPGELPPYDEALLRREMNLFPEWFIGKHLGVTLSSEQQQTLERTFALLIASALAQPKVYVHRDYMPRNLMVSTPSPGILDFQDAVEGPLSYDVVSLFRDAFISWEEEEVIDGAVRYWEAARKAGLPVPVDFGDFWRDFEWMGLQRHLKVLGIFCRLNYRDGKPNYLTDLPRFITYARGVAGRYGALTPLLKLFDQLEDKAPQVGYTF